MSPSRALLVLVFVAGIALPGLDLFLRILPRAEAGEKRTRAAFPDVRNTAIGELPRKLDEWVRDNFGLRDLLIRGANRFRVQVLHESPVKDVLIGEDGWLFYAAHGDGADIEDFLGRLPVNVGVIRARLGALSARRDRLAAHGVTYLLVVPPNKQTVYPEKVPLRRGGTTTTQLDRFAAAVPPSFPFLDLRAAFARGRERRELYYRTDTHWNKYGAFLGFQEVMLSLAALRPGVPTFSDDDITFVESPRAGGDLATMLAMDDVWRDIEQTWTWRPMPRSPLRVVLVGDSFVHYISPFFDQRFAHVKVFSVVAAGDFDLAAVLAEKPDLVIEEHVERYLMMW